MGYDYKIKYKKGSENSAADALSRQMQELFAISYPLPTWVDQVRAETVSDESLQAIIRQLQDQTSELSHYSYEDGLLRYKGRVVLGANSNWRKTVLQILHDSPEGGHSGFLKTYKRVSRTFYWKGIKRDIKCHVASCDICQRNKNESIAPPGLLQPLSVPEGVWTDLSMDFIEGLPTSQGKNTIMVVVDRLSKYAHFIPVAHPFTATQIAQLFTEHIFKLHGMPNSIVSDRDKVFISKFWQEFFKLQGTKLCMSSSYHPQSDGQTEVVNRCLETYLRCFTGQQPKNWKRWLPWAEWWYNTTFHNSTKMTPYEVVYGQPPPTVLSYIPGSTNVHHVDMELRERDHILQLLKENLVAAQVRMKHQADKRRSERSFEVGDMVYLRLQPYRQATVAIRKNMKLSPRFYGPYKILERIGSVAYRLDLPAESKVHPVFHVSKLKKQVGHETMISTQLPNFSEDGQLQIHPIAILDRKIVKKNNRAVTMVLVKWPNSTPEETTWEYLYKLQKKFSEFQP